MIADTQGGCYKVEVRLEERPSGEPRQWVRFTVPGCEAEEMEYLRFMGRPNNIPSDGEAKREASRQKQALMKDWKAKAAETKPTAPAFEMLHVESDRSPHADGFDPLKHMTVYYLLDGKEQHDLPSSLDRMFRTYPERYPPEAVTMVRKAIADKVKSLREQCSPKDAIVKQQSSLAAVPALIVEVNAGSEPMIQGDEQQNVPLVEAAAPLLVEEPVTKPEPAAPGHKPWMDIMKKGHHGAEQAAPKKFHAIKLLDVSKDEAGELSIGAIIEGEQKQWRVTDLEREISEKSTQYPPLALEMLRDKVTRWKTEHEAKSKGRDPVDELLNIARQDGQAEFFHDAARVPFVKVESGDHHEVKAILESDYSEWIKYQAVKAQGKAPKKEPLNQTIDTIAVLARFEGEERDVFIRKGEHDGAFYYDLCNDRWQAVRITSEGWEMVDDPPVMFRRFDHMRPQEVPLGGRSQALDELVQLVNTSDEMRRLLKYQLTASQVPRINQYNAFFLGPQGSTKSTGNDIFKALDDPGTDNRDALPTKEDDLDLHLSKRHTAAYDNISRITQEVSDMLTRANSMGRSSRRALYTNNEEYSRRYKTKIVLNAIDLESGVRPDLLDRTIIYNCEVVTEAQRMGQDEVNARIEELRPYALGACLDTLVKAMPIYHELKGRKGWSPRLKDAYLWMMAIAKVDGMAEADFEALFKKVIERRDSDAMEGDPLAVALEFVAARDGFVGTAGQLHEWLNDPGMNIPEACHIDIKDKTWPKSGIALGKRLPRIIAPLRSRGVFVYQCYHFEVGRNFTDKVRDLNWAKRGSGAYRDQDRMILIAKADIKGTEARSEA